MFYSAVEEINFIIKQSMAAAFFANKTATGFNQGGGFKFVKNSATGMSQPQTTKASGGKHSKNPTLLTGKNRQESLRGGKSAEKGGHGRPKSTENGNRVIDGNTGLSPDEIKALDDQNYQKLVNFYVKIIGFEKSDKPSQNPILRQNGRDAFLSDIEKLRSAEIALNDHQMRLHLNPPVVPFNGQVEQVQVIQNISRVSQQQPGDSLYGGTLMEQLAKNTGELSKPSPNKNNGGKSSNTIGFYEDPAMKSPVSADDMPTQILQSKNMDNLDLDQSKISPIHKKANESMNHSIEIDQMMVSNPLGSGSIKFFETVGIQKKPAILVSTKGNENERITPFELEKVTASVEVLPEGSGSDNQLKSSMIEKSLNDEQVSNHTQGGGGASSDRARVNVLNKFKSTPQASQHIKPVGIHKVESGRFQNENVEAQQIDQPQIEGSINVVLDQTQSGRDTKNDITQLELPVIHAQVNLYKKRQRNNQEQLQKTLSSQGGSPRQNLQPAGTYLIHNSDLEQLWSPPDMSQFSNKNLLEIAKMQRPMQNANANKSIKHIEAVNNSRSRSPRKESTINVHNTITHASFEQQQNYQLPQSNQQKKTTIQVSLSQKLLGMQVLSSSFLNSQGLNLSQIQEAQSTPPLSPLSSQAVTHGQSKIVILNQPSQLQFQQKHQTKLDKIKIETGVVEIGNLSHFDEKPSTAGQFPQRASRINEQRFYLKNGLQIVKEQAEYMTNEMAHHHRAQTASALNRAQRFKNQSIRQQKGKPESVYGDYYRRPLSNGSDGLARPVSPNMNLLNETDGSVVLQATLHLSSTHQKRQMNVFSQQNFQLPQDAPRQLSSQTDKRSMLNSQQRVQLSSDLKIKPTIPINTINSTLDNNAIQDGSELAYFKCQQLSPKREVGGETTTGAAGRDNPSELNGNFTASLPRRYDGQKLIMWNNGQVISFDDKQSPNKNPQTLSSFNQMSRELLVRQGTQPKIDRSGSGSISKRRKKENIQKSFDNTQNKNRVGVLAKTNNRFYDLATQRLIEQEIRNSTVNESSNADLVTCIQRGCSIPNLSAQKIKVGEGAIETLATNSPLQSKNRSPKVEADPFVPVILGEESVTGIHPKSGHGHLYTFKQDDGESAAGAGVLGLKLNLQGSSAQRHREGPRDIKMRTTQQSQGFKINTQKSLNNTLNARAESSGCEAISTGLLSAQNIRKEQQLGQTGISFFGQSEASNNNYNRVHIHSRKSMNSSKRNKIEFKIVQMNLNQAPTSEKSNLMTCQLDLSAHFPNRFKNAEQNVMMQKTLTLMTPKTININQNPIQGQSLGQNWQEVRLTNIGDHDNVNVFLPNFPMNLELQKLAQCNLQRNTASQGSNNGMVPSSVRRQRQMASLIAQNTTGQNTQRSDGSRHILQSRGAQLGFLLSHGQSGAPLVGSNATQRNIATAAPVQFNYKGNKHSIGTGSAQTMELPIESTVQLTQEQQQRSDDKRQTLKKFGSGVPSHTNIYYQKRHSSKKNFASMVITNADIQNLDIGVDIRANELIREMNNQSRTSTNPDRRNLSLPQKIKVIDPLIPNSKQSFALPTSNNRVIHYDSVSLNQLNPLISPPNLTDLQNQVVHLSSHSKRSSVLFKHSGGGGQGRRVAEFLGAEELRASQPVSIISKFEEKPPSDGKKSAQ